MTAAGAYRRSAPRIERDILAGAVVGAGRVAIRRVTLATATPGPGRSRAAASKVPAAMDLMRIADRLWPITRNVMKGHTVVYRATNGLVGHRIVGHRGVHELVNGCHAGPCS